MNKIFVTDRAGKEHEIVAEEGSTLMEIIRDEGLEIEASCGGCCACATCHVYVDSDWVNKLIQKDDDEESMLCLLYTSPSPRDRQKSRMPSSA